MCVNYGYESTIHCAWFEDSIVLTIPQYTFLLIKKNGLPVRIRLMTFCLYTAYADSSDNKWPISFSASFKEVLIT